MWSMSCRLMKVVSPAGKGLTRMLEPTPRPAIIRRHRDTGGLHPLLFRQIRYAGSNMLVKWKKGEGHGRDDLLGQVGRTPGESVRRKPRAWSVVYRKGANLDSLCSGESGIKANSICRCEVYMMQRATTDGAEHTGPEWTSNEERPLVASNDPVSCR